MVAALTRIFDHLRVPAEVRSRYSFTGSANLQKEEGYYETRELSETLLVAGGAVKIAFARNSVIIANGDVEISHGSGLIVISDGSISLAHENTHQRGVDARGIYVARGRLEISHATGPTVYAVKGAKFSFTGTVTAYNTDVNAPYAKVNKSPRAAIFAGEPIRALDSPSMLVDSGESMPFEGKRCATGVRDVLDLFQHLLPMARREANCPTIKAASVVCEQEPDPGKATAESRERWVFDLCDRKIEIASTLQGVRPQLGDGERQSGAVSTGSLVVIGKNSLSGLSSRFQSPEFRAQAELSRTIARQTASLSDADKARMAQLFREASDHLLRGNLLEAREKYLEVLALTGGHASAESNIANINRRIERSDAAVRDYSTRVDAGSANSSVYAARGLVRINYGDVSRGLRDLDQAVALDSGPQAALDRAWGALMGNLVDDAVARASEQLSKDPRLGRAYEIRAWALFLLDRPEDAAKDALSSLVEAPPWNPSSFAGVRAGYRVMAGYLALRQLGSRAKANEWVRQWSRFMSPKSWPDAFALYTSGELDEREMIDVANSMAPADRGNALAEARTFLFLEEFFGGFGLDRAQAMGEHFRTVYSAGRTLSYLTYSRMHTPGQKITVRALTKPQ